MTDENSKDVPQNAQEEYPTDVKESLKLIDSWSFDIFNFSDKSENEPLKFLTKYLLNRYGFIQKFSIDPVILDNFIKIIETGYKSFNNPYHNNIHAADVTQTMHSILCQTQLIHWLTDLEIFACLLAAIIHDYEHTGKTNGFLVMTKSDKALIYNDRSVQENHHLSASFFVLKEDNCNILSGLNREEYRKLRGLVIDLVLSTDMAFHFHLQNDIKHRINAAVESKFEKSKVLGFLLHTCDLSNPAKKWSLASEWSGLIMKEFFEQGDRERELNLPISPLCDRNDTLIPESQINFIDFIVRPTFTLCGDMIDVILKSIRTVGNDENNQSSRGGAGVQTEKPWEECISENRKKWQEKTLKVPTLSTEKQRPSL